MGDVLAFSGSALGGRYLLESGSDGSVRALGRGGMAAVYLGRDLKHDRLVAIKMLLPELAVALGAERFLREVQLAARLIHPHIIGLIDSGVFEQASGLSLPYYVMPYIEGESLRERLDRERHLPVEEAIRIASQVLAALGYAHGQGVVHRDIKPGNILLEGDQALVADFGIARAITHAGGEKLTETGLSLGTPAYMSPEQAAAGHDADSRSDLYSFGCVLYEMLAGQPPFTGRTAQQIMARHAVDPVPSLHTVRGTVPPALERAITRSLAKLPADRFATAEHFAAALKTSAVAESIEPTRRKTRQRRWLAAVALAVVIGAVAGVVSIFPGAGTSHSLDRNLLAVAPFDVLDPKLALWREGVVDLLSRSLEGAGPLRTVAPSVVVRRWNGRADQPSATEVALRTGANLAVYGSIVGAGPDSVRLAATLLDVGAGRPLAEIELRNAVDRMDHLVDSLAVRLLAELGRAHGVGMVHHARATSLSALKAFLQGEQYFRRTAWDSAQIHFERAVALDSTFALALRRLAEVHRWNPSGDTLNLFEIYAFRAAAFNRGLPPRESLLVVAESLDAAMGRALTDPVFYGRKHRLLSTWEEATRRYPDDPEAWYGLGEARWHQGPEIGVTLRQQLMAFERAIALDSGFLLSDPHAVQLGIRAGGAALGRRYAGLYLAHNPQGRIAQGIRAVYEFLARPPDSALFAWWMDSLEGRGLGYLASYPDSTELALRMLLRKKTEPGGKLRDSADVPLLVNWLASRGRVRQASKLLGTKLPLTAPMGLGTSNPLHYFVDLALIGAFPAETAAAVFEIWRRSEALTEDIGLSFLMSHALPWWASRGDTLTLQRVTRRATPAARRNELQDESAPAPQAWHYLAAAAPAYLALARHDTTEALRLFLALPDSLCVACDIDRLMRARLLAATGRDREAYARLEAVFPAETDAPRVSEGFWVLERGRVAERLGKREEAASAYQWVAGIWRHADPELQLYVAEARAGFARVAGEAVRP